MTDNIVSGVVTKKMTPLISFDAIVDSDFGLINLVYDQYLDENIFKKEYFSKREPETIIRDLYYRKDKNPLYVISKEEIDKKILDGFYEEFLEKKIIDIYNMSITTEIISMIDIFNNSQSDIIPTILYYNDDQLNILENEPILSKNNKVKLSSLSKKMKDSFTQFFFKDINEAEPFLDLHLKTFYFSTYGVNFNSKNDDLIDSDIIRKIIKNGNLISIFNLYNDNNLRKENK